MYNPIGLYNIFWLYTKGVIHEIFLLRIYAQKVAPGIDKGKNRRFKKNFI